MRILERFGALAPPVSKPSMSIKPIAIMKQQFSEHSLSASFLLVLASNLHAYGHNCEAHNFASEKRLCCLSEEILESEKVCCYFASSFPNELSSRANDYALVKRCNILSLIAALQLTEPILQAEAGYEASKGRP